MIGYILLLLFSQKSVKLYSVPEIEIEIFMFQNNLPTLVTLLVNLN